MSLLSTVGLTLAFKSDGPGFKFMRLHLFKFCRVPLHANNCIHRVSSAIHTIMNAIGQDRFVVGENSGYANIT
jgi:hypothetical protein